MRIIPDLKNTDVKLMCSGITVGVFDAIHRGHEKLLDRLKILSRKKGLKTILVTFDPYPGEILYKHKMVDRLLTRSEKLKLIEGLGVDVTAFIRFNKSFANMDASGFVERFLVEKLGVKHLIVGRDFLLGKDRVGDIDFLMSIGKELDFKVSVIDDVRIGREVIKSSTIRKLIRVGEVAKAQKLIGRYYSIEGVVIKGKGRGKLLGYHTANMQIPCKLIPKEGVYLTYTILGKRRFESITYIGMRPTFQSLKLAIETYIFDIEKDLLGKKIKLQFIRRIRSDTKFKSAEALKEQIRMDILFSKRLFKNKELLKG